MNVFNIFSDLLKLEKKFTVFGLIAFSGVLILESKYVGSEGTNTGGSSPIYPIVVLLQYGVIGVSLLLILLRWKKVVLPVLRDPFLWGLALMAVLSYNWSDFPDMSMRRGISTFQTAIFGVYLASRYTLKEQLRLIAWAMGITAVFTLLYTMAFPGSGIESGVHSGAWRGPLVHKNLLARLMAMATIPTLLVALDSVPKYRYQLWTVFAITAGLVVLTTSKTGLLIALTLIMLTPILKAMRWQSNIMIPFLVFIVLVVSSVVIWLTNNWEPFLYGVGKDPTLSGRTYLWEASIDKIQQRPWLGYGYQAFWQGTGEANYVWTAVKYQATHSHNGFVNLALDLGLIGVAFFTLSLLTIYIRGFIWLRFGTSSAELWPLLYVSFLVLYNQTESTIIEQNNLFWILHVAVTLSIGYIRKVKPEEKVMRQYIEIARAKYLSQSQEAIRFKEDRV